MKAGLIEINVTFFIQILNTFILYWLLRRFLFKPVTAFMEARQNGIVESIEQAEQKNKQAEQLKADYESKVAGAEAQGREIIKEASKRAETRANEIVTQAQDEASKLKDRADAEIQREKQKAMNSLKDEMAAIVVMAAGKVIDQNLDGEGHDKLIKEFIDEVGSAQWQN